MCVFKDQKLESSTFWRYQVMAIDLDQGENVGHQNSEWLMITSDPSFIDNVNGVINENCKEKGRHLDEVNNSCSLVLTWKTVSYPPLFFAFPDF